MTSKLIWIAGIVLLTASTIRGVIPLLDDYSYNNVATQISVGKQASERPQNMTIYIPYYSGAISNVAKWISNNSSSSANISYGKADCLECDEMALRRWNLGVNMINNKKSYISQLELENEIAAPLIKKLLDDETDFAVLKLNQTNFNWHQPIIDAVWQFLKEPNCSLSKANALLVPEDNRDVTRLFT